VERPCAGRAIHQFAATRTAAVVEIFGTFSAVGAFHRADERARRVGGKADAAQFAIGAHFEHHAPIAQRCRGQKRPRSSRFYAFALYLAAMEQRAFNPTIAAQA